MKNKGFGMAMIGRLAKFYKLCEDTKCPNCPFQGGDYECRLMEVEEKLYRLDELTR